MDNKENAMNMRRVNTPSVPPPQLTKTPIKVFGTGDDGPSPKMASTSKCSKNTTSIPEMLDEQTKQTAKSNTNATLTKLASPTTATVAGDFRDGNKMVNISSEDVLQVLMKGTQPLGSGTPAKVVGKTSSNDHIYVVRTDDGGVYHVRADKLRLIARAEDKKKPQDSSAEQVDESCTKADGNKTTPATVHGSSNTKFLEDNNKSIPSIVSPNLALNSDAQQALDADPLAGFELSLAFGRKPHPSSYENLTTDQVRGKLSETYETLFGAIEIGANEEVPRLMEAIKCLNSRLEELGYPQPSKLSAQITMTRAQIQVAVKEKKFDKCSAFQDKLDRLVAHDIWLRDATKHVTSATNRRTELNAALKDSIEKKEWSKCTSLKAELEVIDTILSMVTLEIV